MSIVDQKTICQAIKAFRLKMGYDQSTMAKAMHCCRSAYSYKELGTTAFSIEDVQYAAALFGFSPDVFFHPEFFPELALGKRPKRKCSIKMKSLGDLTIQERKLIGSIRAYEAENSSKNLLEELLQKVTTKQKTKRN